MALDGKTTYPSPPAPVLQLLLALGRTKTAPLRATVISKAHLWFAVLPQTAPLVAVTSVMAAAVVVTPTLLEIAGAAAERVVIPAMGEPAALLTLAVQMDPVELAAVAAVAT